MNRQIAVYRPGALPLDPTRNPFEKGFLDFLKLSRRYIYQFLLKVLKIIKGLFQKSLKWGGEGASPLDKLKFTIFSASLSAPFKITRPKYDFFTKKSL